MLSMGGMCAPPLSCDVAEVAIVHKYTQPNLTIFKNMKKIKILSNLSYSRQLWQNILKKILNSQNGKKLPGNKHFGPRRERVYLCAFYDLRHLLGSWQAKPSQGCWKWKKNIKTWLYAAERSRTFLVWKKNEKRTKETWKKHKYKGKRFKSKAKQKVPISTSLSSHMLWKMLSPFLPGPKGLKSTLQIKSLYVWGSLYMYVDVLSDGPLKFA